MNELYRLLIVDDEIILRNGVKYLCNWEEYGFVVVGEASNGKEALELIPVLDPHIVIIDIVMPIMNGIDFTKFEGCDKYREETRKKYNIGDNEIVIGVVGRLSEQKDPMTTIKAFNEVYKENKNVRLMYVGSGELEDEVMKYAKENNLQHLVTITGWVDNTERYI